MASDRRDACRLRRRRRHGIRRRYRHRRKNESSDHSQTKKDAEELVCFHKNDPPLIVEKIVEDESNVLVIKV